MSRRCPFCERTMELKRGHGAAFIDDYVCRVCGCEWCFGLSKLPNPERLRREADELETIADEIERGEGLAGRIKGALS